MKVSICIPAYEMHGKGATYMEKLLLSIKGQTYTNYEVIVSDQSANEDVRKICVRWSDELCLRYLTCQDRGNSSINANNAIAAATGAVIKVIHQDDLLYSNSCLATIVEALEAHPHQMWGVCRFVLTDEEGQQLDRYWTPFYNPDILFRNTIGVPSVLFYRASGPTTEKFDPRLIYMNDSELYYRLYCTHGEPLVIGETLVAVRLWSGQVTHTMITKTVKRKEILHLMRKHGGNACMSVLKEVALRCVGKRRPDLSEGAV